MELHFPLWEAIENDDAAQLEKYLAAHPLVPLSKQEEENESWGHPFLKSKNLSEKKLFCFAIENRAKHCTKFLLIKNASKWGKTDNDIRWVLMNLSGFKNVEILHWLTQNKPHWLLNTKDSQNQEPLLSRFLDHFFEDFPSLMYWSFKKYDFISWVPDDVPDRAMYQRRLMLNTLFSLTGCHDQSILNTIFQSLSKESQKENVKLLDTQIHDFWFQCVKKRNLYALKWCEKLNWEPKPDALKYENLGSVNHIFDECIQDVPNNQKFWKWVHKKHLLLPQSATAQQKFVEKFCISQPKTQKWLISHLNCFEEKSSLAHLFYKHVLSPSNFFQILQLDQDVFFNLFSGSKLKANLGLKKSLSLLDQLSSPSPIEGVKVRYQHIQQQLLELSLKQGDSKKQKMRL